MPRASAGQAGKLKQSVGNANHRIACGVFEETFSLSLFAFAKIVVATAKRICKTFKAGALSLKHAEISTRRTQRISTLSQEDDKPLSRPLSDSRSSWGGSHSLVSAGNMLRSQASKQKPSGLEAWLDR